MTIDVTVRAVLQAERDTAAAQLVVAEAALIAAQEALAIQTTSVEELRALVASLDASLVEEE